MAIRLYIGNLSYSTTQEELSQLFSEAGSVASASLMTDRYSGQSRGFGFIEMSTDEEAQNAIRLLHGRNVSGREIVVNEARQRTESGARPSGGHRSPAGSSYGGGGGYNRGGSSSGYNRSEGRRDRYDRDRY